MNLEKLLEDIQKRPGMYLPNASLTYLELYLTAYSSGCLEESGLSSDEFYEKYNDDIGDFQRWVSKKYKITSLQNWSQIIRFYEITDISAFNKFFELYKEFTESRS